MVPPSTLTALPELQQKVTGRANPYPTRSRCRRTPPTRNHNHHENHAHQQRRNQPNNPHPERRLTGGRAPRSVPVLARYHSPLLEAAGFAGQNFLTGGTEPERGNITNPLTRSLAGGTGLPPLDTSRLRATWLAETAALIGLATFLHAAGISCCQQLGDITAGLAPGSEADAITLLGARTR